MVIIDGGVKTAVSGDDLRAMGLKPGPAYGIILNQLLAARLDGQISSVAEEQALLEQILTSNQWASSAPLQ